MRKLCLRDHCVLGVNAPAGSPMTEPPPQQVTEPSERTPQELFDPAEIAVNVPDGEVAWPRPSSPQQVTEPLVRNPHE